MSPLPGARGGLIFPGQGASGRNDVLHLVTTSLFSLLNNIFLLWLNHLEEKLQESFMVIKI